MATIDIYIENYIDEIDDYYLIRELKRRADNKNKKAQESFKEIINEMIKGEEDVIGWPKILTVADKQKQEWIIENWDNIKL